MSAHSTWQGKGTASPSASQDVSDDNILRIMVSTDNHLGVWERDEWRGNDSFMSFREVFERARFHKVDFVLLGGDLFHENKPSRNTLVKCLDILNEHCLSDDPINFQMVSDPSLIQAGLVNTQDPNLNVGLPVFTIHGNHDDPAGAENLSAVDILSTVHYVNYFGKHVFGSRGSDDTAKIDLSPILLQKGATKVALYGLGFMREERLARAFQNREGHVTFQRPAEATDEWFNVFVLHQNRVQHYKQGPNNAARNVQQDHMPDFLDLVVWGHEHESHATPDNTPNFSILQPGSSVATSLSEPESKQKHCYLVEVRKDEFRVQQFPLRTVRPFKFLPVCLKDHHITAGDHKQVEEVLAGLVEELIEESHQEQRAAATDEMSQPLGPDSSMLGTAGASAANVLDDDWEPRLPLIRLRVDYTGYSTIHSQRFGQRFVNKVANPNDILLWSKAAAKKQKAAAKAVTPAMPADLDNTQIEDLIAEFAGDLEILPASELGEALRRFVEKDEKMSLTEAFDASLEETQKKAMASLDAADDADTAAEAAPSDADIVAGLATHTADGQALAIAETLGKVGKELQAEADKRWEAKKTQPGAAAAELTQEHARDTADASTAVGAGPSTAAATAARGSGAEASAAMPMDSDDQAGPSSRPPEQSKGRQAGSTKRATKAAPQSKGKAATNGKAASNGKAQAGKKAATGAAPQSAASLSQSSTKQRKAASAGRTKLAAAGLDSDEEEEAASSDGSPIDDPDSPPKQTKKRRTAATAQAVVPDSLQDEVSDDDLQIVSESQAPALSQRGLPASLATGGKRGKGKVR